MGVGDLRILKVLQDDFLIGVAPLKNDNAGWSFLGDTSVFDYQDFVIRDGYEDSFFEALLEYLEQEQWETLTLVSLREGSLTLDSLPRLAKQRGYGVILDTEDVSPGVFLPQTFDDYVSTLSKKDRHELRRKIRRLDATGDYRILSFQNAEDLPVAMDEFLMLMRQSRTDKDQFLTPTREQFFRNMVQELAGARQIQLYFLEVNGSRVAGALCFDYQGRRFLYNSGYNLEYSSLSVGLLLKAFCLRDAIDQGMEYFDFLRGTEPYKYNLGAADVSLYQMTVTRSLL